MEIKRIIINKNRGWRGLAEVRCYDSEHNNTKTVVFSFSQAVWDDMLKGVMVIPHEDKFLVLYFDNTEVLPRGQRSVLIKTFNANVTKIVEVPQAGWWSELRETHPECINYVNNHCRNNNIYTRSDWNCIGIRVIPTL